LELPGWGYQGQNRHSTCLRGLTGGTGRRLSLHCGSDGSQKSRMIARTAWGSLETRLADHPAFLQLLREDLAGELRSSIRVDNWAAESQLKQSTTATRYNRHRGLILTRYRTCGLPGTRQKPSFKPFRKRLIRQRSAQRRFPTRKKEMIAAGPIGAEAFPTGGPIPRQSYNAVSRN